MIIMYWELNQLVSIRLCYQYSGCNTTVSFSYVTEIEEGKMERARGSKMAKSLSEHV
jgi:hypothetical protein